MALIADELLNELAHRLQQLGLEVTGDEVAGFTIRCEDADLRTTRGSRFGTTAEALAVALIDLLDRVSDLVNAAAAVASQWERGDLASAVRDLDVCLNEVAVSSHGSSDPEHTSAWLRRLD